MAKLSPVFNWSEFINGIPASGAQVFTYAAGSSTKQNTYTDESGITANPNPIILDARGEPPNDIWLTEGQSYKFVFTASTDTDPPTSPIRTIDDITGVNDTGVTTSQWVDSGVTPTYVSATQFTVPGDQTSTFQVNRRIKATVTAGTVYGYISVSAFAALTTVTVVLDSGSLDSGLSAVQLGLITPTNTSLFLMQTGNIADGAITTPKLADEAVTPAKLSDDAFISIIGESKNLVITNNSGTPNSQVDIDADEIILKDASLRAYLATSVNLTANIAASGANGLDTGVEANSTWYYLWVIYNGTTVASLISASSTSPTLPSGYTYKARVGAIFNDGSGNFISYYQSGNEFWTDTRTVSTSVPGTSYASVSLADYVPAICKSPKLSVEISSASGVTATIYYSPNNSDTLAQISSQAYGSSSGLSPIKIDIPLLTAQTIYAKRVNAMASLTLKCNGGKY